MGRKVRSSSLYQGLFLLAFGLYANSARSPEKQSATLGTPDSETPRKGASRNDALEELYSRLEAIPVFQGRVDGVELKLMDSAIFIELQSADLYRPGSEEIEAAWHSSMVQIGHEVYSRLDPSLELEITGFGSLGEGRAKWLKAYFQNQFQGTKSGAVKLLVVDGVEASDRIRLRIARKSKQ
ncbi:MAG: hypothetical protein KGP28_04535 [Bdellovibrionales bacterium]|nr:hypothetical protein [Bdellovibrionales bacterium]